MGTTTSQRPMDWMGSSSSASFVSANPGSARSSSSMAPLNRGCRRDFWGLRWRLMARTSRFWGLEDSVVEELRRATTCQGFGLPLGSRACGETLSLSARATGSQHSPSVAQRGLPGGSWGAGDDGRSRCACQSAALSRPKPHPANAGSMSNYKSV